MQSIHLFETTVTTTAKEYVNNVLDSTWLNEGKYVRLFEDRLKRLGFLNPVTVNSCTSALHLCLRVLGIGPGDEVILPAQTFLATGMVVLQAGAIPIFADIDPQTGNISPQSIQNKITNKTKAIIVVHWGGLSCQMEEINKIAKEIPIIEDAAHAFGGDYQNAFIGTNRFSDFSCFSFQAIKNMTSGDGGLICVKDSNYFEKLRKMKWFGFDRDSMQRRFEGDRVPTVDDVGYKYNMNDIAGALAFGNLDGYMDRLKKRREIASLYRKEIRSNGVQFLRIDQNCGHAYWVFTMLVEKRKEFIQMMKDSGIPVSVLDRRIDEHPIFNLTPNLLGQELFDEMQISIPVHHKLEFDQIDHIISTINKGW